LSFALRCDEKLKPDVGMMCEGLEVVKELYKWFLRTISFYNFFDVQHKPQKPHDVHRTLADWKGAHQIIPISILQVLLYIFLTGALD